MDYANSNFSFNSWKYLTIKDNLKHENYENVLDGQNYQNIHKPWNLRSELKFQFKLEYNLPHLIACLAFLFLLFIWIFIFLTFDFFHFPSYHYYIF